MRSQTPQNKKPCEGWGDVTGQEIIGRRTLWDINGFICSDSVSCHVSLELLFSFSSPQNPGRNNLGSWQSWNLHQEKKLHQDESSPDSSLVCVWSWVFYSKVSLPCWLCGFHNTILLLHCFVENPCRQPKKDLEWEGERKEELKLCGQTCRGGVGADQRNCVHSHHGFRSPCLCFTCWCW